MTKPPRNKEGEIIVRDENVFTKMRERQSDVSSRALSIARIIDRLPPGTYQIELVKFDLKGQPWDVCAWERQKIYQKDVG